MSTLCVLIVSCSSVCFLCSPFMLICRILSWFVFVWLVLFEMVCGVGVGVGGG